jgi:hypothetical protein
VGDGAKKTFNIVRHLDDATLKKIADALGIPEAEHERITSISGEIHIGPPPAPASGGASRTPPAGGSPPSPSGGSPPTLPSGGAPPTPPGAPKR